MKSTLFPGVMLVALMACGLSGPLSARTVYRCVLDGSVSLATAPEPGSICTAQELDDNAALVPNLWGDQRARSGALYRREQDGQTVYSTRELPGSTPLFNYTVVPPPGSPVHAGMGEVGAPRLDAWPQLFRSAAKRHRVDDALLRAVAHAESSFDALAVSAKGAQGVMQLMPATARDYAVVDPFSPAESISAGARHLGGLLRLYDGDRRLAAAAYNAGQGAVARYGGVPPYAETQRYVAKVEALYQLYTTVL